METQLKFIKSFLGINYYCSMDAQAVFEAFEAHCNFRKETAGQFQSAFLTDVFKHYPDSKIFVISDLLENLAVLFQINGAVVLLGPFVQSSIDMDKCSAVLGENEALILEYRYYRSNVAFCELPTILRAIISLTQANGIPCDEHDICFLNTSYSQKDSSIHTSTEALAAIGMDIQVSNRYHCEERFMEFISRGMAQEAIHTANELLSVSYEGVHLSYFSPDAARSIMRTLVRIAAFRSGLAPLVIDTISQEYAQKLANDHIGREAVSTWLFQMIRDICREIRKNNILHYSPITQKVLFMVAHTPADNYSISEIAQALHISESTLAHTLKKETGFSLNQIVQQERCRLSAKLLSSSNRKIQDISIEVGYSDANYFTKIFKKHYNLTPAEYRQKYTYR